MMTQRERFFALLYNEPVDGFVNQYGAFGDWDGFIRGTPIDALNAHPRGVTVTTQWGITYQWNPEDPGAIPLTDPEHLVIKDIEEWQEYLHAPDLATKDSDWDQVRETAAAMDTTQYLRSALFYPGTFEFCHSVMTFEDSLSNLLIYPDEMHDIIQYISDWRHDAFEETFKHIPDIDALFAHDDWGSRNSTFMRPETFEEFFLQPYKEIYAVPHEYGAVVAHHCDSYSATLMDYMIEMGMDYWEGCLPSNNIPELQKKLADMNANFVLWGGLDSAVFDRDDSTEEEIRKHVDDTIAANFEGGRWIPSVNDGLPVIIHQANYDIITDEINKQEAVYFG